MSNVSDNRAAIQKYRDELKAMLGDIAGIDARVLTRAVNFGLTEVKKITPVGQYPGTVSFTTKDGKQVFFDVAKKEGGTLRRGWNATPTVKTASGVEKSLENNVEYAPYVNDGHRVVNKAHETVGFVKGRFMLEKAVAKVDAALVLEFNAEVEKVAKKYDR